MRFKGTPRGGLFGATLGFFIGFAAVGLFGPTAARFKDLMDLSPMMVGWLVSAPALSGSLLRIPFAAWVDSTGGRRPFLVLLLLSVLGMAGLALMVLGLYPDGLTGRHYPMVLALGVLCGCGIATFSVGVGQVSYWFRQDQQGSALGLYAGLGNLAPGLFSLLLPVALAAWGLAGSYLAWLAFLAAGTAVYALIARNAWYFQAIENGLSPDQARSEAARSGQTIFPSGTALQSLRMSARTWKTWALIGVYFTTFGGFIALTAWFPVYWKEFHGATAVMSGALTAAYSITASAIRAFGGKAADRLGGGPTMVTGLVATLGGAILMAAAQEFPTALVSEIVLALGMGIANAGVFKLVPQEVPQAVGGAAGWIGGLGAFGGFVIPPLMAACVDRHGASGYPLGFVLLAALALLSLGLAGILGRARRVGLASGRLVEAGGS